MARQRVHEVVVRPSERHQPLPLRPPGRSYGEAVVATHLHSEFHPMWMVGHTVSTQEPI